MTYQVPLPYSGELASQFFVIFEHLRPVEVSFFQKGSLKKKPLLEGGRISRPNLSIASDIAEFASTKPGSQLTSRVTPSFSNAVLEHPTQEGFSLDHTHAKLNVFEIEATLYEGRSERLDKLNDLRINNTLLTIVCDMGVFKNYIISDVNPIMSSSSANVFEASITFQEVRRMEIISPDILTYTDAGEEHGDDISDIGKTPLTLRGQVFPEKKNYWATVIDEFIFAAKFPLRMVKGLPTIGK